MTMIAFFAIFAFSCAKKGKNLANVSLSVENAQSTALTGTAVDVDYFKLKLISVELVNSAKKNRNMGKPRLRRTEKESRSW